LLLQIVACPCSLQISLSSLACVLSLSLPLLSLVFPLERKIAASTVEGGTGASGSHARACDCAVAIHAYLPTALLPSTVPPIDPGALTHVPAACHTTAHALHAATPGAQLCHRQPSFCLPPSA
jgi:hypothetical protein